MQQLCNLNSEGILISIIIPLFNIAKACDILRVNGPRGTFILRHTPDTDVVFLAKGTGIAPVKAVLGQLKHMPKELKPKSVKVFWGMQRSEDLYWNPRDVFNDLNFTLVLYWADKTWEGARGYVQDIIVQNQTNIENMQIYACVSSVMIGSARAKTVAHGLNMKYVFADTFVESGKG